MSDVLELDPMETREFEVEHAVENLTRLMADVAGYRLNNEGRRVLLTPSCMLRLLLSLDALQITVDDLEGKYHG